MLSAAVKFMNLQNQRNLSTLASRHLVAPTPFAGKEMTSGPVHACQITSATPTKGADLSVCSILIVLRTRLAWVANAWILVLEHADKTQNVKSSII
jgi:hypothetical protein